MLGVSQSSVTRYLQCEQQYYYADVLRLNPKERAAPPELGNFLHDYLQGFYTALALSADADAAHQAGLALLAPRIPQLKRYVATALMVDAEPLARQLADIPRRAIRIAEQYLEVRGRADAVRYRPTIVEQKMRVQLTPTIYSTQILDLVTLDTTNGKFVLWEHKSTENPPSKEIHIWDLQTVLYAAVLDTIVGYQPDMVLWNYLRTVEPTTPQPLKGRGKNPKAEFSHAKDLDTTWTIYRAAVEAAGADPAEYRDVQQRLDGAETRVFFPRHDQRVTADQGVVLRDYIAASVEIEAKRTAWELGDAAPIRTLSRSCRWCRYAPLCKAVLTGGDEEGVIQLKYSSGYAEEEATSAVVSTT